MTGHTLDHTSNSRQLYRLTVKIFQTGLIRLLLRFDTMLSGAQLFPRNVK